MNTIAPLVFRIQSYTNVMKDIMEWIADDSDDRKKVLWYVAWLERGRVFCRPRSHKSCVGSMSLDFQFANLLSANALKSVEWSEGPIILVIDALDEYGSKRYRKILMQALSKGIRIMVVSRWEHDIQHALESHFHLRPYPLTSILRPTRMPFRNLYDV
jgi:hypothetical protein